MPFFLGKVSALPSGDDLQRRDCKTEAVLFRANARGGKERVRFYPFFSFNFTSNSSLLNTSRYSSDSEYVRQAKRDRVALSITSALHHFGAVYRQSSQHRANTS